MNRKTSVVLAMVLLSAALVVVMFLGTQNSNQETTVGKEENLFMAMVNKVKPVDRSASFAIYTNGTFRVFAASMYHNLSQDVYIAGENPNIIRIKEEGVTWNDFFSTLPFKFTEDCLTTGTGETFCTNESKSLKFYLNGERNNNVLENTINDGDKLLISYGDDNQEVIDQQLQKASGL